MDKLTEKVKKFFDEFLEDISLKIQMRKKQILKNIEGLNNLNSKVMEAYNQISEKEILRDLVTKICDDQ